MKIPRKFEETPVVHQGPLINEVNAPVARNSKKRNLVCRNRLLGSHEKILAF